jgi:putative ABC transport system permease protein
MNWLIFINDLKRNKIINFALFMFMMFSATLAVLSVIMAVQTFTSISGLYKTAQPPHFVQMHKGEINEEKIKDFMSNYSKTTYWQTITMIDVYGENITVVGKKDTYNFSDCRLDIGMVKQASEKDLLLNTQHEKISLNKGEIGIPVILKETYNMEIGDTLFLNHDEITEEFVIKEFVLDSMMNSTMASSTRILLSDEDFHMLEGKVGENEYLIEAYFSDPNEASAFQTAYENEKLPQNGQAITYTIIFILSALTDIITIFVLLLVCLLLIIVSFICIKFTIMATLEEEISEIGTLKAIGFPYADIRDLYLIKYRTLAIIGVISGFMIAFIISSIFTNHISTTFGNMKLTALTMILSIAVGIIVYLLINYYCKKVLRKIKRLTVVDALVSGNGFDKYKGSIRDGLNNSKKLNVNLLMGFREVYYKFNNWVIVFAVVIISVMMFLIPVNLLNTFEAPEFITYMGSSLEDILIEVENGDNLETGYLNVKNILEEDIAVRNYFEYKRIRVQTFNSENEPMNIHVDTGINSGNELKYLNGTSPETKNEIAISLLNAEKIGKNIGDKLILFYDNKEHEFIITGIYQDVTSGGFTAKSKYDFPEQIAEKYTFSVNINDNSNLTQKANEWSGILGAGVTVDPMKEFINQTLGGVSIQLKTMVLGIAIICSFIAILITVLFLKLRLAKDLSEIAILKAIGFSEQDLKQQYMIKTGSVSLAGIIAGIILTNILGERIVNIGLSVAGIGLKRVELIANPVIEYIICPVLLITMILIVTWMVVKSIKKYNIISIINE